MFAVIKFSSENHRDNEDVTMVGPFATRDSAGTWAENNARFYHVVRMAQPDKRDFRVTPMEPRA